MTHTVIILTNEQARHAYNADANAAHALYLALAYSLNRGHLKRVELWKGTDLVKECWAEGWC